MNYLAVGKRWRARWMGLLACFAGDRRAVAMIEFAVVTPILVLLLLPLVDLGLGFYVKTQLMTAAEAGTQYAFVNGWSGTSTSTQTSILSAVSHATGLGGVSASPAPVLACGCADGTTIAYSFPGGAFSPSACSAMTACTSGQKPGAYVTVNTQVSYRPVFTYLVFSGTTTLSATSTVRIQ